MLNDHTIVSTFFVVDEFLKASFEKFPKLQVNSKRGFSCGINESEIITICLLFQFSHSRNFKAFYQYAEKHLKSYFPNLVSYSRFISLKKKVAFFLYLFLVSLLGKCTGLSFVDSTSLAVCKNKRIPRHRVFKSLAKRGKTTMGWFFGFKLHLTINHLGEILGFDFTEGNVDDRTPVKGLCKKMFGKLFGDKGYISSKLFLDLFKNGVQLITNIRKAMKNQLIPLLDKLMLRKRSLIETTFGILKKQFHLEHSRHRSPHNFIVNLFSTLIAYCLKKKKPSLQWHQEKTPSFLPKIRG